MASPLVARSALFKWCVTIAAIGVIVWWYETAVPDPTFLGLPIARNGALDPTALPTPGVRQTFSATAYCKGLITRSGVAVQTGVVAADPAYLPVGSVVDVSVDDTRYNGIYTVLDTGPEIRGREVDIYMWGCNDALRFGRRQAQVTVLRLGWDPRATTPGLLERVFGVRGPAAVEHDLPSRPLPIAP